MRVNVYSEELTGRVEVIEKQADTGNKFVGIRFILKTHEDMLMPLYGDNDDSAVTFWADEIYKLKSMLSSGLDLL